MLSHLRRLLPGHTASAADRGELRAVGDDHPKDMFFTRPLVVTSLAVDVQPIDQDTASDDAEPRVRVSFVATIKDADGKRCPEMAVYARITGPHRSATGMGHTSMLGQVTFRMSGPEGDYACTIEDVAGGALGLDRATSVLAAEVVAAPA